MLRAMRACERRRVAAADAYDRGQFADAAAAYAEALACVEVRIVELLALNCLFFRLFN